MKLPTVTTEDSEALAERSRFRAAMILAVAADALQIFVFPLFAESVEFWSLGRKYAAIRVYLQRVPQAVYEDIESGGVWEGQDHLPGMRQREG